MDNDIVKALIFLNRASEKLENGKSKKFICPLCGGNAKATRSSYNGHLWAKCDSCGESIRE